MKAGGIHIWRQNTKATDAVAFGSAAYADFVPISSVEKRGERNGRNLARDERPFPK
jgi:hypothetical protein